MFQFQQSLSLSLSRLFQILVKDKDFSTPNNQLVVTTSGDGCLLESSQASYDVADNKQATVTLQLTDKADYDTMSGDHVMNCHVMVEVRHNDNDRDYLIMIVIIR